MIRPSFLQYLLGHGTSSTTGTTEVSHKETELRRVAYLRRDKDLPSRNSALLNRISDIVLILRADVSIGMFDQGLQVHLRGMPKHRRYGGSRQPKRS